MVDRKIKGRMVGMRIEMRVNLKFKMVMILMMAKPIRMVRLKFKLLIRILRYQRDQPMLKKTKILLVKVVTKIVRLDLRILVILMNQMNLVLLIVMKILKM